VSPTLEEVVGKAGFLDEIGPWVVLSPRGFVNGADFVYDKGRYHT